MPGTATAPAKSRTQNGETGAATRNAEIPAPTAALLKNWFTYHAPSGTQTQQYQQLREKGLALAEVIVLTTPPGPDQEAAILRVREAVMLANAAIACG